MAPSDETLSNTIRSAVRRMFQGPDRDNLTVNQVREYVESELGLEEGFLKGGLWKQESKNIVKTEIVTNAFFGGEDNLLDVNAKFYRRTSLSGSKMLVKSSRPFSQR